MQKNQQNVYPTRRQALAATAGFLEAASSRRVEAADVQAPSFTDETWQDTRRQRAVPVRIRWPSAPLPDVEWPVVVYSHGLGGSRYGGEVWGNVWAAAGLVVVHLQHAGSDIDAARSVTSGFKDQAALRSLGGGTQLLARMQDVIFALDEMARRKVNDKLWRSVRLGGVGMAGHSFGAHTTLGVGGQAYPNHPAMSESRIAALVALSPSVPAKGDAAQAFAAITRPTLCITGTLDDDVMGNGSTPDKRASVFAALPAGNKAMLLLKDADHMSFSGVTGRAAKIVQRQTTTTELQPVHHALVARTSTDWWQAHLMGDEEAKARLQKPQGMALLDRWQTG